MRMSKGGQFGLAVIVLFSLLAVLAPVLPIADPVTVHLAGRMDPPSWSGYLFGSDQLGRDLLSRVVYGGRVTLSVVAVSVLIAGAAGVTFGLISGFYGGWVDRVLMRIADLQLAFPLMLLALTVIAVLGPNVYNLVIVLVIAGWVRFARVVRGEVLSIREREFVLSARASGAGSMRIMFHHVLPGVMGPMIVIGTLEVARMILMESALSFLGLGTQPPYPSWGRMLADGRSYIANAWWISVIPGLAIVLTVLAVNMLGDSLRDWFKQLGAGR
jgi:peptide/nickel transport system permease protein